MKLGVRLTQALQRMEDLINDNKLPLQSVDAMRYMTDRSRVDQKLTKLFELLHKAGYDINFDPKKRRLKTRKKVLKK